MFHPQFYRAKLTFMSWKDPMLTTTCSKVFSHVIVFLCYSYFLTKLLALFVISIGDISRKLVGSKLLSMVGLAFEIKILENI